MYAATIAAAALRAHALSRDGAVAAFCVGSVTYAAGGWPFSAVLLGFFAPSIALSRIGRARKKKLVDIGKSGARDAWQVLANGGVATVCALAAAGSPAWLAAFAGSYAAATADTWGTEIGTLMRGTPRSILTLRPVRTGFSGGVTPIGTLAEIAGAAWLATVAAATLRAPDEVGQAPPVRAFRARLFAAVWLGGVAGALLDSLLGATVQELRRCPVCERTCETDPHVCGTPTVRIRGVPGFSNDLVNFAATLSGAAVALRIMAR